MSIYKQLKCIHGGTWFRSGRIGRALASRAEGGEFESFSSKTDDLQLTKRTSCLSVRIMCLTRIACHGVVGLVSKWGCTINAQWECNVTSGTRLDMISDVVRTWNNKQKYASLFYLYPAELNLILKYCWAPGCEATTITLTLCFFFNYPLWSRHTHLTDFFKCLIGY